MKLKMLEKFFLFLLICIIVVTITGYVYIIYGSDIIPSRVIEIINFKRTLEEKLNDIYKILLFLIIFFVISVLVHLCISIYRTALLQNETKLSKQLYNLVFNYCKNKSEDSDMTTETNALDTLMNELNGNFSDNVGVKVKRSVNVIQQQVKQKSAVTQMMNAQEDAENLISSERVIESVVTRTQSFENLISDISTNGISKADLSMLMPPENGEKLADKSERDNDNIPDWKYLSEHIQATEPLLAVCRNSFSNPNDVGAFSSTLCLELLQVIETLNNVEIDPIIRENLVKNITIVVLTFEDIDEDMQSKFAKILSSIQSNANSDNGSITGVADNSNESTAIKLNESGSQDQEVDINKLAEGLNKANVNDDTSNTAKQVVEPVITGSEEIIYLSNEVGEYLNEVGIKFFDDHIGECVIAVNLMKDKGLEGAATIDFSTIEFAFVEKLITQVKTCAGTHPINKTLPILTDILVSVKEKMKSR